MSSATGAKTDTATVNTRAPSHARQSLSLGLALGNLSGPLTEVISANSSDVTMLEMGEDEGGAGDVVVEGGQGVDAGGG